MVIVPFTDGFANQPAEEYVEHFLFDKFHPHTIIIGYDHRFGRDILVNTIGTKHLIVGYDHRFGRHREGNFTNLQEYASLFDKNTKNI